MTPTPHSPSVISSKFLIFGEVPVDGEVEERPPPYDTSKNLPPVSKPWWVSYNYDLYFDEHDEWTLRPLKNANYKTFGKVARNLGLSPNKFGFWSVPRSTLSGPQLDNAIPSSNYKLVNAKLTDEREIEKPINVNHHALLMYMKKTCTRNVSVSPFLSWIS